MRSGTKTMTAGAIGIALVLGLAGSTDAQRAGALPKPAAVEDGVSVYFSPNGGCMDALRFAIGRARTTIDVQAFILSTSLVSRPLEDAAKRGVRVRIIMDSEQAEADFALDEKLAEAGVAVYRHAVPEGGSMHHKTMVIDGATVITGSFNFSRSAQEKNAENLVVITGKPRIAAAYTADFEKRLAVSKRAE